MSDITIADFRSFWVVSVAHGALTYVATWVQLSLLCQLEKNQLFNHSTILWEAVAVVRASQFLLFGNSLVSVSVHWQDGVVTVMWRASCKLEFLVPSPPQGKMIEVLGCKIFISLSIKNLHFNGIWANGINRCYQMWMSIRSAPLMTFKWQKYLHVICYFAMLSLISFVADLKTSKKC